LLLLKSFHFVTLIFFVFVVLSIFYIPNVMAESTSINLSNTSGESFNPQLLVIEDKIFSVWSDKTTGNIEIFFTKNINDDLIFENPSNLSNNSGISNWPRLVASDENVYVTWYDYTPCKSDIYFSKIREDGTFATQNISNNPGVSYNPWIAYSENNVYVVWNDSTLPDGSMNPFEPECQEGYDSTNHMDILFAKSWDDGESFHTVNLSDTAFAWNARIRVSEGNVYVAWNQNTESAVDVFFSTSSNYGTTFSEPINISNSQKESVDAGFQVVGDNIYMVWEEGNPAEGDVFFAKSVDGGKTFSIPINLSNNGKEKSKITRDTQIQVSGNNIFVVWYNTNPDDYGVFFIKSSNGGETFSQPIKMNNEAGPAVYPQIVAYDQNIYVIWTQYDMRSSEESDIFFRKSNDGGATFGSIENLSKNNLESVLSILGPQIAVTQDSVYTLWVDKAPDGGDLYIKVFEKNQGPKSGIILMQTTNGAVNIEIEIEEKLEKDVPVDFNLKFIDPTTGKILENVNYSLSIKDSQGNKIISRLNQYTESGIDTQIIRFSKNGPMTIEIEVQGLGNELPYATKYSGNTSAIITDVPEFPIVMAIMVLGMISIIVMRKIIPYSSLHNIMVPTN